MKISLAWQGEGKGKRGWHVDKRTQRNCIQEILCFKTLEEMCEMISDEYYMQAITNGISVLCCIVPYT